MSLPRRCPRCTPCLGASLAVLVAALALDAAPALAQSDSAETTWQERMQTSVNEANDAYNRGDFEEALVHLRQAETIAEDHNDKKSLAALRFNIARCLEKLGRKQEALEAYEAYDRLPDLPHRKQKAFAAMERLRGEFMGVLAVTCQQEGSTVVILRISEASAACPFRSGVLEPGRYEIEVVAPGFATSTRTVQVRPGATTAVDFDLSPLPQVQAPAAPAGIALDRPPSQRGASPWPWVTIGGGAVLAATGGVFYGLAVGNRDDAQGSPPSEGRDSTVSDFETNRAIGYTLIGVGSAVAIAGIVWKIIEDSSGGDDSGSVGVQPTANGFQVRF